MPSSRRGDGGHRLVHSTYRLAAATAHTRSHHPGMPPGSPCLSTSCVEHWRIRDSTDHTTSNNAQHASTLLHPRTRSIAILSAQRTRPCSVPDLTTRCRPALFRAATSQAVTSIYRYIHGASAAPPRLVVLPLFACCVKALMVVLTFVIAVCMLSLFLEAAPSFTPFAFSAN